MLPSYSNNCTETLYTLSDAEKIINYRRKKEYQKQKTNAINYLKQKVFGIVLIAIGIISIFIEMDFTLAIFIVPTGLFFIVTNNKILEF